jgi:hypothetical protein
MNCAKSDIGNKLHGNFVCRESFVAAFIVSFLFAGHADAALLVDFSPNTTEATLGTFNLTNQMGTQRIGDHFTLSSGTNITGGAIFSQKTTALVGDSVQFTIFPESAGVPLSTPVVDVTTTLDVIDFVDTTSEPLLDRKHASITATFLPAGTYWFALTGVGVNKRQANTTTTGGYDDSNSAFGPNDLSLGVFNSGDMYFQLEGNAAEAVPEPSTLTLAGLGLFSLAGMIRRLRRR